MVLNKKLAQLSIVFCFVIVFVSCSKDQLMNQPITFNNQTELYRLLEDYKSKLDQHNYVALTDAIAFLKAVDTQNSDLESFYGSINNLSPDEIIERASSVKSQSMKFKNKNQ